MKLALRPTAPKTVEYTLEVTMTMPQWERLHAQIALAAKDAAGKEIKRLACFLDDSCGRLLLHACDSFRDKGTDEPT